MASSTLVDAAFFPAQSSSTSTATAAATPVELPQDARRVLETLAMKLWGGTLLGDLGDVCVRPLKGALTNEVYQCSWIADAEEHDPHGGEVATEAKYSGKNGRHSELVVLVRIYGEGVDLFFDREDEIRTFEAMSKTGHGPRLLARFRTGRIEEFLHARTLTAEDLRNLDVSARIALKLREFHGLSMPGRHESRIWQRLRDWLQKALTLSSPEHIDEFRLRELGNEVEYLRLSCSKLKSELGFCHNDLQYGNIMMDKEDSTLTLIDYEYSSYNPVAYDLANHFCEMAANYHTDTPHLLDYSKYPDWQERRRFIKVYLGTSGGELVDQLMKEVDFYSLASHIHWGLWGIISDYVNEIDFDYLEYARQRFREYYLSKSKILDN